MPIRFLSTAKPYGEYPIAETEDIQHGDKRLNTVLTEINTVNASKADKTYVDAQLATKADRSNTIKVYETVSEMKSDINIFSGSKVKTNGFHASKDGGGAEYIVKILESEVVDEQYIISLSNNLIAILIDDGNLNVHKFGAWGDGIHDDRNSILKMISVCNKLVLGVKMTYYISNTILIDKSDFIIEGNNSTLKSNSGITMLKFDGRNSPAIRMRGVFKDFFLDNPNNQAVGIHLFTVADITFYNVESRVGGIGLKSENSLLYAFYECTIRNSVYAIYGVNASGNEESSQANNCRMIGCRIIGNKIVVDSDDNYQFANNFMFISCEIEQNHADTFVFNLKMSPNNVGKQPFLIFDGCWFEENTPILFRVSNNQNSPIIFRGNTILATEPTSFISGENVSMTEYDNYDPCTYTYKRFDLSGSQNIISSINSYYNGELDDRIKTNHYGAINVIDRLNSVSMRSKGSNVDIDIKASENKLIVSSNGDMKGIKIPATYDNPVILAGNFYMWSYLGRLYCKNGYEPSSGTDGTPFSLES